MSPDTQCGSECDKMSVAQLEQFVSFIVRRCGGDEKCCKPRWWPRELAFRYPVQRVGSMDVAKWRETLLDVIAKCYSHRSRNNGQRPKRAALLRRDSARSATAAPGTTNGNLQPVVTLCDVLKFHQEANNNVTKASFLDYFQLEQPEKGNVIQKSPPTPTKPPSHYLHLLNTPHVPISSDLGRKMTKECHIVPQSVHERRLERVERYLSPGEPPKNVDYEVSCNKLPPKHLHTYVFPTRSHHKGKLSKKANFLLEYFCKPCSIPVTNLQIPENFNKTRRKPKRPANSPEQKENTKPGYEPQVRLTTPHSKENQVLKALVPSNGTIFAPKITKADLFRASVLLPLKKLFTPKKNPPKVRKKRVLIYQRRFSPRVLRLRCIKK